MPTERIIKFNVKTISNGFILDATFPKNDSKPADEGNYQNHRYEKKYFSKVDVMCDFIKEHFTSQEPMG